MYTGVSGYDIESDSPRDYVRSKIVLCKLAENALSLLQTDWTAIDTKPTEIFLCIYNDRKIIEESG